MRIYDQLEEMKRYIADNDWDGLEKNARKRAEKLAGKDITAKIAAVDLSAYTEQLEDALKEAYERAEEEEASAVYFEYDMDNAWAGTLYVSSDYQPEDEEDDDWASNCDEELEAPECPALAEIYAADFDASEKDRGTNGYLIARTVAAFGRCVEVMPDAEFAVCIAFHDQTIVTRIRDTEGREPDSDDDDEDEDD